LYEILVVDDGSDDRTGERLRDYQGIRLLTHHSNRGYGAALKTGIRHAIHDLICITDADGTYPNERIPELLQHLIHDGLDMVVGARVGERVAIPLVRRPAKWAIGLLAQLVASEQIPDINSGLRIARRSALSPFLSMLPDGFSLTTTITLGMLTNGYLVGYVPIDYRPRVGRSKIRPIRDTLAFIQLIFRISLYFAPLKIFLPISLFLFIFALLWGIISYFFLGRLADVSTLVLVTASIQIAAVGLLAELLNRRLPSYHRDGE
jgi:glycosyltransferase involved in cell wall biosynthesis